jgi:hypothetical protein
LADFKIYRNARLNDDKIDDVTSCNERCRKEAACRVKYAVNEFTLLCMEFGSSFSDEWYYFKSVLENPWYDETLKYK